MNQNSRTGESLKGKADKRVGKGPNGDEEKAEEPPDKTPRCAFKDCLEPRYVCQEKAETRSSKKGWIVVTTSYAHCEKHHEEYLNPPAPKRKVKSLVSIPQRATPVATQKQSAYKKRQKRWQAQQGKLEREKARKARKPVYDNAKAENPGNVNSWKPRNALSGKLVTDNDETGKLADGYIAEMMKYLKDRDR